MRVTENESYKVLKDDENLLSHVEEFLDQEGEGLKDSNLVLDLSENENLSVEELKRLLPWAEKFRISRKSFVVVNHSVDIDEVPLELSVVPTLGEAEDLIQMEEIERDLGF